MSDVEVEPVALPGMCDAVAQLHQALLHTGFALSHLTRFRDQGERGDLYAVRRDLAVVTQQCEQVSKWVEAVIATETGENGLEQGL